MHFHCKCGHETRVTTDYLPYVAEFLAHQDVDDLSEGLQEAENDVGRILPYASLSRRMYQCVQCQRIFIENHAGGLVSFVPEDVEGAKAILSSSAGQGWKRHLRARWNDASNPRHRHRQGLIDYSHTEPEREFFGDWNEFENRYHALFEELKSQQRLRTAHLHKNNQLVHSWQLHRE